MTLSVMPDDTPDELDLELMLLGAELPEGAELRIHDAVAGPLSDAAADIERCKELFARERLPIREVPRSRGVWPWAVVLAAAAALALVLLWPAPDGIRSMGTGLPVDLTASRDGAPVEAPLAFRAGDQLGVSLSAPVNGWLNIGVVQANGQVFPLVSGETLRATRGQRVSLDQGIEIDAYEGREWLVLYLSTRPVSRDAWASELADSLPDPGSRSGGRWFAREVTRAR